MDGLRNIITPVWALRGMLILSAIYMICTYLRRKHKLLSMLWGMGSGIAALLLCRRFGAAIAFQPPLTAVNLAVSGVGGIPAVLLLFCLQKITK